jgi:hypothetical protein
VNTLDLFKALSVLIPAGIQAEFGRYDCCILSTRVAIEIAAYFGVHVRPMPVRVVLLNAAFAKHLDEGDGDVRKWADIDGSHSVGIGLGFHDGQDRHNLWNGHLIAASPDYFADFAIQQAERPAKGIITGPAVICPVTENARWRVVEAESGTEIQYERTRDTTYLRSPDWKDGKRRRKIAGAIIRILQQGRSLW